MTNQPNALDYTNDECAKFQAQLPDLFGSGMVVSDHPHLQTCHKCSSLVRDLEYIAEQAKTLMDPEPSDAVWQSIVSKLELEAGSEAAPMKTERS